MVWTLILAHFLGDFPLQPNWMVRQKSEFWVISLHVGIHFVLMFLLVGQARLLIWPYLLLLTLVHLGQDHLKIILTARWPALLVPLFILDQIFHYAAIWGLTHWMGAIHPNLANMPNQPWVLIATAYVVVTSTWFIVERVINHANSAYQKNMDETKTARMFARAGLVSLFLLVRAAALPYLAVWLASPYPPSIYRKRALLSDLGISLVAIIFLLAALGT